MLKSLHCIMLITSILSVSLFGNENIGLTKEIENRRESVVCAVETGNMSAENESEEGFFLGYTDGFWVEEDETVYLLKSYGNGVLELKRNSAREIALAESVLPADVISYMDKLYVFDDILSELQIYTKQGEFLVRSKIELKKDYVKGLAVAEEGVVVLTYDGQRIYVNPETGKQKKLKKQELPLVDVADYDYAEYVGTDEEGTVYSVHTTLVQDCSVISGELTLRAVSAEGELLGCYVLPVEEYKYLPGQYVQIMGNGNIYLLVPGENSVEVRKVALKETMVSRIDSISEAAEEKESVYAAESRYRKRIGTACTEKIRISRDEVKERSKDMAEYRWTLTKTNTQTAKSEKGVVLPREIAAVKKAHAGDADWSEKLTGIPYCWGGFHALDVGTKNQTFKKAIDKKFVAGNINPEGYYKYMTAGLDCSGFVSAAFGFKTKQSTKGLSDLGSKVSDVRKMEQMDILVYPGEHVIFFCEWINETTMLVSESAAREGKVVIHPKSLNELVVGGTYQMRSPW